MKLSMLIKELEQFKEQMGDINLQAITDEGSETDISINIEKINNIYYINLYF